jgi:hypothetical protein
MDKQQLKAFKDEFKVGQVIRANYMIESKKSIKKIRFKIIRKYDKFMLCDFGLYKGTLLYTDFINGYVKVM